VTSVLAAAHEAGVQRLLESYAAIPEAAPVRLSKQTSNLFRARAATTTPGLETSGLTDVIEVDPVDRTADVQGMCTYERLVEVTLAHGLTPRVVPQLRTITLGGAVTGLGIESASWRNGLPHESVLEMDVLTGSGELVTADGSGRHPDLFRGFPNSYGTLGYATRLRIELEPVALSVSLRHCRFHDIDALVSTMAEVVDKGSFDGEVVGVLPRPGTAYGRAGADQRLHRSRDLLPLHSARRLGPSTRPAQHPGLPLAVGHRLVLVLARLRCPEPPRPSAVASPVEAQQGLLEARRRRPALRHR
jgi:FAD/FMN-containing dehydrogenase